MKKFISSATMLGLILPLSTVAASIQFMDVPSNAWFTTYVEQAAEVGIVSGYADAKGNPIGKFGPADSVTVAQILKIAIEGAGYNVPLYDAARGWQEEWPEKQWYDPYLAVSDAEQILFFHGPELNFNRPATRQEVAYIMAHAFRVALSSADENFVDVTAETSYAFEIAALSKDGVLTGDTDASGNPKGTFRPDGAINRAEAAKIVMEARKKYDEPGKGREPVFPTQ